MRIQLIADFNGYGMSKDAEVLKGIFESEGHEVDLTPVKSPRLSIGRDRKYHWNLHIEILHAAHLPSGMRNALIPNPEWYYPKWDSILPRVEVVLAKTRHTEHIFKERHKDVRYTGFCTPDPGIEVVYSRKECVHIAGQSLTKGTEQVIEAMRMLPEIKCHVVSKGPRPKADNVTQHTGRQSDERIAHLLRSPVHIQPSTCEGWGHVIHQAKAAGGVVISTQAPPMDEFVTKEFGFLASPDRTKKRLLGTEYFADPEQLADCIRSAVDNLDKYGKVWGARARASYEKDCADFKQRLLEIVQ